MDAPALKDALLELAREAGLEVRSAASSGQTVGRSLESGTCRVHGSVWIVLADADPVREQVELLAAALSRHATRFLEARYLPPAVRRCLEAGRGQRQLTI